VQIRHPIGLTGGGGRARTITLGIALAALPALASTPALHASTFQVNPVVLEVPAGGHNAAFTIRNSETTPISIQVKLLRWTQTDGEDVYDNTDDLIASPPIVTVPAAGAQLVRVGPRWGTLSGAYRVIVEEILPPAGRQSQVRIALRLNLPLYVMAAQGTKGPLRWSGWREASGDIVLQADNLGTLYQSVVGIDAVDSARKDVPLATHFAAVLPGGSKRWNVGKHPGLGEAGPLELAVRSSDGVLTRSPVTLVRR